MPMQPFDVDWLEILNELPRWTGLSVRARTALLNEVPLHGYVPGKRLVAVRSELVASELVVYQADRDRIVVNDVHRSLLKVMRAMGRHRLFNERDAATLHRYIRDYFTNAELERLVLGVAGRRIVGTLVPHAARHTDSGHWVTELLNAERPEALLRWLDARGVTTHGANVLEEWRAVQVLVRWMLAEGGVVPLELLLSSHPDHEWPALAASIHRALGTVVLVVGLSATECEPLIGLWDGALAELTREPAAMPVVTQATEQFSFPLLMEDMTAILATLAGAPIRLRANDLAVFARTAAEIGTRLTPIPGWVVDMLGLDVERRVNAPVSYLVALGLARVGGSDARPSLVIKPAGSAWLARSSQERLAALLQPIREDPSESPPSYYGEGLEVGFFPVPLPLYNVPPDWQLRRRVVELFLSLPDGVVSCQEFLTYAAETNNPLAGESGDAFELQFGFLDGGDAGRARTRLWCALFEQVLFQRLVPYGGVSLGLLPGDELGFRLNAIGRYLLGASDAFTYGSDTAVDVVVQPNFDVVLLGSAPAQEATLARVAERVGPAPGRAFVVTRESVLRAAQEGMTGEDILTLLDSASSKAVPANVAREVVGWVRAVRRARTRTGELLECEDAESADRLQTLLEGKAERLGPRHFELLPLARAPRTALFRKLREKGVLLEEQVAEQAPRRRRRR